MSLTILCVFCLSAMVTVSFAQKKKEQKWKEHRARHFIIYYKEAPESFVKTVEDAAEQYYDEISKNLGFKRYQGWTFDERAKIYIYDDTDDYVNAGRQASWSHGVASPKDRVIRTFPTAHGFFDSTLPHELAHIIFREFVGFRARLPHWFEEGVAMLQEKARRFGSDKIVREAIEDGTFIPLKQLGLTRLGYNTARDKVELFYAESASVVNFLMNKHGKTRFVRFCRKLEEGGPFEWALQSVYVRYKSLDDLNKDWVRSLKAKKN